MLSIFVYLNSQILIKEILKTTDGSYTLYVPELDETYHSTNGALQESNHVFIEAGLKFSGLKKAAVLEVGFGTGLNALTTFKETEKKELLIEFTSLEAYPLTWAEVSPLDYMNMEGYQEYSIPFEEMHSCDWGDFTPISSNFSLRKLNLKLQELTFENTFDIIYFDAFAPQIQPELWTEDIFALMYKALKSKGVLVTYCAKGTVKRALKAVGFQLQSIPGPPGKREMSRAVKGAY